jgi:hypothetical protein
MVVPVVVLVVTGNTTTGGILDADAAAAASAAAVAIVESVGKALASCNCSNVDRMVSVLLVVTRVAVGVDVGGGGISDGIFTFDEENDADEGG